MIDTSTYKIMGCCDYFGRSFLIVRNKKTNQNIKHKNGGNKRFHDSDEIEEYLKKEKEENGNDKAINN